MSYVYFIPPPPVHEAVVERPSICSPQRTGVWGPLLIIFGGAGALLVAFFIQDPAIIWPIIGVGVVLCALGVYIARRHVKVWREQERERQRAMWRAPNLQPQGTGEGGGGRANANQTPAYDLPMYCLEAPSRPLNFVGSSGTTGPLCGGGAAPMHETRYDNEFWCALAVPLHLDDYGDAHYLEWAAMTLVVQPHFKFLAGAAEGPMGTDPGLPTLAPSGRCDSGGGRGGDTAAAAAAAACSGGLMTVSLTRTGGTSSRRRLTPEAAAAGLGDGNGSEPHVASPSLTLVRTSSLGLRANNNTTGGMLAASGSPFDRRTGRLSLTGRMGDLLSLFASVATGGGSAGGGEYAPASGGNAPDCETGGGGSAGDNLNAKQQQQQMQTRADARQPAVASPMPAPAAAGAEPGPSRRGRQDQRQLHPSSSAPAGTIPTLEALVGAGVDIPDSGYPAGSSGQGTGPPQPATGLPAEQVLGVPVDSDHSGPTQGSGIVGLQRRYDTPTRGQRRIGSGTLVQRRVDGDGEGGDVAMTLLRTESGGARRRVR